MLLILVPRCHFRKSKCPSLVFLSLTVDYQIAGRSGLVDQDADRAFLISAQSPLGGFGKEPEDYPDPYHSYLALAALALSHSGHGGLGLSELDAEWNVSVQTAEWLRREIARVKRI